MLDNIQIAILIKVNELAERHGIKPYQFCAVVRIEDPSHISLSFEVPVSGDSANVKRFNKMLDQIGFGEDTHTLMGSDKQIIDALDKAIHHAPKSVRKK
jgi:hypothetical protein